MANTPTGAQGGSQTKEHLQEAKEHLKEAGSQAQQAGSSAARGATQQAQSTASNLTQKAKEAASSVAQQAQDVAGKAQEKADGALSTVGEKMSSLASSIRSSAPHEGVLGSAATTVADKLESSGRYLRESGMSEISDDLADVVRRHPIPSVLAVFGVGFLIGMAARR